MVDRLIHSEANSRRITMVEGAFGASGQPLVAPGRVLVGEGVLTKMCRKRPKQRQFFLFNDILVYGNIVINKKKYNKQHLLPLEGVRLQSIEDDTMPNGWLVITPSKSFAVYAATVTEKMEWMGHIQKCVDDLLTKSGRKAPTEESPVWIPDSDAPFCMHCHKTKFTPLNRRHHCRNCGKVVCGGCSSHRFLLPHQSVNPLRVCDRCFIDLSAAKENGTLDSRKSYDVFTDGSSTDSDSDDPLTPSAPQNPVVVSNPVHEWDMESAESGTEAVAPSGGAEGQSSDPEGEADDVFVTAIEQPADGIEEDKERAPTFYGGTESETSEEKGAETTDLDATS